MKLNTFFKVLAVGLPLLGGCYIEPIESEPITKEAVQQVALFDEDEINEYSDDLENQEAEKTKDSGEAGNGLTVVENNIEEPIEVRESGLNKISVIKVVGEVDTMLSPEELQEQRLINRDIRDLKNQEEDGEFYVPLPGVADEKEPITVLAKTLYVTNNIAGFNFDQEDIDFYAKYVEVLGGLSDEELDLSLLDNVNRLEEILGMCKATEINALVIDIKNDHGVVAWESDIDIVNRINSNNERTIKDYDKLLTYLKDNNIYSIARVVAFKDPYFAKMEPDHAMQLVEGGLYLDRNNEAWVSSFDQYVWDYVVSVSKEAALRGFDEIQYDYVRFPDNAAKYNPITYFPGRNGRDKDEGIEDFLEYACNELEPYGVNVSADVFGQLTRSWDDSPEDIGQTWRKMANHVDYMCPMLYPSHYGKDIYGFSVPDQYPYEVVKYALEEALERNSAQRNPGIIRPWIQGFTAPWVNGHIDYGTFEISEQIRAAHELGIEEYIIWDAHNTYDPMIFFWHDRIEEDTAVEDIDIMGRSPEDALTRYLVAEKYGRNSQLYLLTPRNLRVNEYDIFENQRNQIDYKLEDYDIHSIDKIDDETFEAKVTGKYTSTKGEVSFEDETFTVVLEDGIYKIIGLDLGWINKEMPLGLEVNEMGRIMVLMYHNIGPEEKTWVRTPENFIKDLSVLYKKGYRPISLNDYVSGNITTKKGYTPFVITIDDANLNNFEYLEDGTIDPNCLVGLLLGFHESHPDFPLEATFFADGQVPFTTSGEEVEKIQFLLDMGMDMGNHTKDHKSLTNATAEQIQEYIGYQCNYLESLIEDPDYKINTLALPYGERPKEDAMVALLGQGVYEGLTYNNVAVLNVGWNPAYSPYDDEKFDPLSIPRIRASEMNVDNVGMYNYIEYFDNHPEERFISDGNP